MNKIIPSLVMAVLLIAGCKKDNFKKPESLLTGRVVYNKEALGLRSNGVQLELWQHGFELFTKIPVYLAQDGTFSASLFNGSYRLVLRQGNGPWRDVSDSLDVAVNGTTNVEVPVRPYFVISNVTFTKNGNTVTAVFSVTAVDGSLPLEAVSLYVGRTDIVDQVNNAGAVSTLPDISQPVTMNIDATNFTGVFFARVGVKTAGVAEQVYSTVEKLQ